MFCKLSEYSAVLCASTEPTSIVNVHLSQNHSLYLSPDIARGIKCRRLICTRHIARMGEGWSAYETLTGKPLGRRHLGRYSSCWENIKWNLKH